MGDVKGNFNNPLKIFGSIEDALKYALECCIYSTKVFYIDYICNERRYTFGYVIAGSLEDITVRGVDGNILFCRLVAEIRNMDIKPRNVANYLEQKGIERYSMIFNSLKSRWGRY